MATVPAIEAVDVDPGPAVKSVGISAAVPLGLQAIRMKSEQPSKIARIINFLASNLSDPLIKRSLDNDLGVRLYFSGPDSIDHVAVSCFIIDISFWKKVCELHTNVICPFLRE